MSRLSSRSFRRAGALLALVAPLLAVAAPVTPVRINEYRVKGARLLSAEEIEETVYPFLGPDRDPEDVEKARSALEKLYREKGYSTVSVVIPEQEVVAGIVRLQVNEVAVGRLRVKGAKFTNPSKIKAKAPSLAEGKVIDFNQLPAEIATLNQNPDSRVTPSINPGREPGTLDVDLEVKDRLPIHVSAELNNRAGPSTKPLRANLGVRATNLWQRNHTLGLNSQISPQDTKQVKVFSGFYSFKPAAWKKTSVMFNGQWQDSDVSTLGSANAVGRNRIAGVKLLFELPGSENFFQTASFGVDWKRLRLKVSSSGTLRDTPVTYFPLTGNYAVTWSEGKRSTELDVEAGAHLRGTGSSNEDFDFNRYRADGAYLYLRSSVSHTQPLFGDWQAYARLSGQLANQPLLSLEQFSAGGQSTVRGYLESEAVGDEGVLGTFEFRTPNLAFWDKSRERSSVRLYGFVDGAYLTTKDVLFDQASFARLASYGAGVSIQLADTFTGALDVGVPRATQSSTQPDELRVTFRAAVEY